MARKRKGLLTVPGEWAKHFQKKLRRKFWKRERNATRLYIRREQENTSK